MFCVVGGGACCLCLFGRSRSDVRFVRVVRDRIDGRFVRVVRELPFVLRTLGFVVVDYVMCKSWGTRFPGLFLWCFVSLLPLCV